MALGVVSRRRAMLLDVGRLVVEEDLPERAAGAVLHLEEVHAAVLARLDADFHFPDADQEREEEEEAREEDGEEDEEVDVGLVLTEVHDAFRRVVVFRPASDQHDVETPGRQRVDPARKRNDERLRRSRTTVIKCSLSMLMNVFSPWDEISSKSLSPETAVVGMVVLKCTDRRSRSESWTS